MVDVEVFAGRPAHPRISYFTGSSTDPAVIAQIDEAIVGERTLIILDSDHRRDHVLRELRAWHSRVSVGSYVIVEDSNINGHPVSSSWGPGPMETVDAFLEENDDFVVDESMHKFFMTFNPRGYLKRVK
jgi:cephalosporin hydroxylase